METRNAKIIREESKTSLKLSLPSKDLEIVLTEDNPNKVKAVFNELLKSLKSGEFCFELEDDNQDLFFHVCSEYIKQLNVELSSIYRELKDSDLIDSI